MKRNVSNKIYEIALLATGLLAIFNLVGVWVTWNTGNPVGYVAGTLEIVGLAACGVLAFLNEKVVVRKQWFAWAACFILHILFFVLCITLTSLNSKDNAVPALFTVLLICITLAITFVLLKDRVIIKSDGSYTYLLPDIAYHANKLSRGYKHLIDVLGADHHGYIDRLNAAITMVGGNANLLDVEILQMVRVMENGEEVKMSKRSGKAITLIDLIDMVGVDALRYFYVEKSLSTHMDLNLDLMRSKSSENPVYYASYAHARIASVFRKLNELGIRYEEKHSFNHLDKESIKPLCSLLIKYPKVIETIASNHQVYYLTNYIQELSYALHTYYNDCKIITDNVEEINEKMSILNAVKIVLKDALSLVGVTAPESMTNE